MTLLVMKLIAVQWIRAGPCTSTLYGRQAS